jgi:hypothetical protein
MAKNRTNINNINYNQLQLTTLITSSILPISQDECEGHTTSSSLVASPPPAENQVALSHSERDNDTPAPLILPKEWFGLKLDLYQNSIKRGRVQLTLKLGIIPRTTKKSVSITAQLNSPLRHMYKGLSDEERTNDHWQKVEKYVKFMRKEFKDLRGSKFYTNKKEGTVPDLVGFVYYNDCWTVDIINNGEFYQYCLLEDGSESFRTNNGIATTYVGSNNVIRNWIDRKALGI